MATKRTAHRSTKGKKLYAVKGDDGRYRDIQTYKKAYYQSEAGIRRAAKRFSKTMKRLADS